jgi:flagellin
MALVINTNVPSLTSQRALHESGSELSTAMERLSTGLKINAASDDAAGLAMTQRMTAQVRGLSMAVKNANDGMAMTKSVEGAIGEVSDMLQRMRELAIQAANGTNSSADRTFLQNEVNLLIQEITRVSTNTRYNGELILDGTFINKNLQVGIEEGEVITLSVESIAAEKIGAYTLAGNGVGSRPPQIDPLSNPTSVQDDIEIFGFLGTKSIAASVADSAKLTATKINNLTGLTGVKAYAKTYAALYSTSTPAQTYSVKINGYSTGNFVISSGSVQNGVDAINQISGATGVTAHSEDNKIVLFDSDGDDITIENLQSLAGHDDLRVRKIDETGQVLQADGVTYNWVGAETSLAVNSVSGLDATRVTGTLKLTSPNAFSVDQKVKSESTDITSASTVLVVGTPAGSANSVNIDGLSGAEKFAIGDIVSFATENNNILHRVSAVGSVTLGAQTITISPPLADALTNNSAVTIETAGYMDDGSQTAQLRNLTHVNISTTLSAGDSISIIDAALDKVAQMRANLGAIENRLDYTITNLMNIGERTADSRSRLQDADYALESSRLAKSQVVQQAGTQMLAQSNTMNNLVLELLK